MTLLCIRELEKPERITPPTKFVNYGLIAECVFVRGGATGSQKYRAIFGHFGSLPYFNITETTKRRLLNYPINRSTGCGSELGTRIHKKYIPLNAIAGWWWGVTEKLSSALFGV